ncbi:hypothetical protein KQX54_012649 [Cotesia glomerata]|uniref:Uncharacterized protein n=1 Tax=Cotesia glomerata TaxID=32391 RepID=A0AAV7IW71_COTGL|nr:hypothetical protein KQX54_012649 [Cotesia glomerata]
MNKCKLEISSIGFVSVGRLRNRNARFLHPVRAREASNARVKDDNGSTTLEKTVQVLNVRVTYTHDRPAISRNAHCGSNGRQGVEIQPYYTLYIGLVIRLRSLSRSRETYYTWLVRASAHFTIPRAGTGAGCAGSGPPEEGGGGGDTHNDQQQRPRTQLHSIAHQCGMCAVLVVVLCVTKESWRGKRSPAMTRAPHADEPANHFVRITMYNTF